MMKSKIQMFVNESKKVKFSKNMLREIKIPLIKKNKNTKLITIILESFDRLYPNNDKASRPRENIVIAAVTNKSTS